MKILIMGGTRFVGRLLVKGLIKEGHDITILTRGISKDTFQDNVKRITCLRSDKRKMVKALRGKHFDIVYDQICFSPDDAEISAEIFHNRITKYIFTSSVLVYKQRNELLKEKDFNPKELEIRMGNRSSLSYEDGKRLAEAYFQQKAEFPVVSVRFPIVMDNNDYTKRFIFHIERILQNRKIYIPENPGRMNFINAAGAANFLSWLKEVNLKGAINASSQEPFNADELIELFSEIMKKKAVVVKSYTDEIEISPYYMSGDLVMDLTKGKALGYDFPSFFSWFPREVKAAYSNMDI